MCKKINVGGLVHFGWEKDIIGAGVFFFTKMAIITLSVMVFNHPTDVITVHGAENVFFCSRKWSCCLDTVLTLPCQHVNLTQTATDFPNI